MPTQDGARSEVPGPSAISDAQFERLYREHIDDARRLATILVGPDQADELVAESFARVLAQLRAGRGPTSNFRSYLQVTIRNGFRDILRATRETPVSDQPWLLDQEQPPVDELLAELSPGTAVNALATLPESWQKVLWHVEVEGRKPREVAGLLGMRSGAVSSLSHRAREGLRQAYLDQHVVTLTAVEECGWTRRRLSQYVRHDLSVRAEQKVATHLDGCAECSAAYLQVDRINDKLAAWVFPVVLLGALPASGTAAAWLAGVVALRLGASSGTGGGASAGGTTGAGSTGAGVGGAGVGGAGVGAGLTAAVAAAALAAVAAVGVVLVKDDGDHTRRPDAAPAPPSADTVAKPSPQPAAQPRPGIARHRPAPLLRPVAEIVAPPAGDEAPGQEAPVDETTQEQPTPGQPTRQQPPPPPPPPPSGPTVVQAVAPTATPIQECETYGALELPSTDGVAYALTSGDGQSGPWQVEATALPGYVLDDGSPSVFTGDLGSYTSCPDPLAVSVTSTDPRLPIAPWKVQAEPYVADGPARTITVRFDLNPGLLVRVEAAPAEGWTCRTAAGSPVGVDLLPLGLGPSISCDYAYTGETPPGVALRVEGLLVLLTPPTGTVTLLSGGVVVDTMPFG